MVDRFVGRTRELQQVVAAWEAAPPGRGTLVVVTGEAGVGKSRFCAELADRARRAGRAVAEARCWVDGGAPALWPWQPILRDLCGGDGADLVAPASEEAPDAPGRFERFAAVTDRIAAAGARTPLCIVVDDVHGADAATLLLIRYVAHALHRLPLALVLSRRPGEPSGPGPEARLLDELERDATPVLLPPFDAGEAAAFLADHGLADIDPDLAQAVFRLTGGNPLFLRRVAALGPGRLGRGLPSGLHVAIDQAWSRLAPPSRQLIRASSILGLNPMVREAAAVNRAHPIAVLDAVAEARHAGLVDAAGPERFAFSHELVRSAIEAGLPTAERLEAHARAAAVVAGDAPVLRSDQLARRAHHALAAAARSADDARLAVEACRDAARAMIRGLAYEQADALLSAAVELHEAAGLGHRPADLLVQWAQAALHCGRLTEARRRFDWAASVAERTGDAATFAEAALGAGGVWAHERRTPVDRSRVLALQRAALAALPAEETTLACRLRVRLAAEAAFDDGTTAPLLDALDEARASGDPHAHAEALQLAQHALFSPEHNRLRLALSDEQVRVASGAGNGLLALLGLYWRAVNHLHLGDKQAPRALEDLRERAHAVAHQEMQYLVAAIDVMLLIRQGRLEEAEADAHRAFAAGQEVGADDALGYLGGHLLAIRWAQGREHELLDMIEDVAKSPTRLASDFSFWAVAAAIAARNGQPGRARAGLDRLTADGLGALHRSSTWLGGMTAVVEAAAALGDAAVAREAYDLLAPYADLPTMVSAMLCLGSTRRPLGLAAATVGDLDRAVEYLGNAVTDSHRFGNRPFATIAQRDLAATLARRGRPGDRPRAEALYRHAIADAEAMAMTAHVEAWAAELADLDRHPSPAASGHAPPRTGQVRRSGPGWRVTVDRHAAVVPDLVGMRYLAELLTRPGDAIPALDLAAGEDAPADRAAHQVLDDEARRAYTARVRELTHELHECEAANDLGRVEVVRAELDALMDQLASAAGLGHRVRTFADDGERARTSVRKAIKRAIDTIDHQAPEVGQHLRLYVVTGTTCSYTPPRDATIEWSAHR